MAEKATTIEKTEVKKGSTPVNSAEKKEAISPAILTYQNEPYLNKNIVEGTLTEEQKIVVDMLDKAMKTLPDMELNRITIPEVLNEFIKQANVDSAKALVGKVIENAPYMSTTKNSIKDIVKRRFYLGLSNPVCFVIHTNGKAKGIDVVPILKEEGFGGGRIEKQQEVILARGSKFRVGKYELGYECEQSYPIIHLYAE